MLCLYADSLVNEELDCESKARSRSIENSRNAFRGNGRQLWLSELMQGKR